MRSCYIALHCRPIPLGWTPHETLLSRSTIKISLGLLLQRCSYPYWRPMMMLQLSFWKYTSWTNTSWELLSTKDIPLIWWMLLCWNPYWRRRPKPLGRLLWCCCLLKMYLLDDRCMQEMLSTEDIGLGLPLICPIATDTDHWQYISWMTTEMLLSTDEISLWWLLRCCYLLTIYLFDD